MFRAPVLLLVVCCLGLPACKSRKLNEYGLTENEDRGNRLLVQAKRLHDDKRYRQQFIDDAKRFYEDAKATLRTSTKPGEMEAAKLEAEDWRKKMEQLQKEDEEALKTQQKDVAEAKKLLGSKFEVACKSIEIDPVNYFGD